MKTRHLFAGCLAALMFTFALAACGGDDDSSSSDNGNGNGNGSEETSQSDDSTLEVIATDFSFGDLPDSIDAGTTITLRNDAQGELHELVAFRLDDDETRSIDEIIALPQEEMQTALGAIPSLVMLSPPGSSEIATPIGDGTLSEPGRYALVCLIPTGVPVNDYLQAAATSDGPPDVGDGPPHIVHGMYAEIEVR